MVFNSTLVGKDQERYWLRKTRFLIVRRMFFHLRHFDLTLLILPLTHDTYTQMHFGALAVRLFDFLTVLVVRCDFAFAQGKAVRGEL